ncbi:hypothetical protein Tco_1284425 [Tanacetum coccineum]
MVIPITGTKKYQGSNSNDGGNTGDGVKIAGEVIGSGDEIEFSEELKELLLDELVNNPVIRSIVENIHRGVGAEVEHSKPGFELQEQKVGNRIIQARATEKNLKRFKEAVMPFAVVTSKALWWISVPSPIEDRFQYLVRGIGMRCLTPAELKVLTNESA